MTLLWLLWNACSGSSLPEEDPSSQKASVVPADIQKKSDSTPGLDLSYLEGQDLSDDEKALLQIAKTDNDSLLEYSDLYVHKKDALVSELTSHIETLEAPKALNTYKALFLAYQLNREKIFPNLEAAGIFSKIAVNTLLDSSQKKLCELGKILAPLYASATYKISPEEKYQMSAAIRVVDMLNADKKFWQGLPTDHPYKKFPVDEIVDTFLTAVRDDIIKIVYDEQEGIEIGTEGSYSWETKTLTLHKNFYEDIVIHEATHAWQDLKQLHMARRDEEVQGRLVGSGMIWYRNKSENYKDSHSNMVKIASNMISLGDSLAQFGDPTNITNPEKSIGYLASYFQLQLVLNQFSSSAQQTVKPKIDEYVKISALPKKQEEVFLQIVKILEEDYSQASTEALGLEATKRDFMDEAISALTTKTTSVYNTKQAYHSAIAVAQSNSGSRQNVGTSKLSFEKASQQFIASLDDKALANMASERRLGIEVSKAYFFQCYQLAFDGKTQEAVDYFDTKILPIINGPIFFEDMTVQEAKTLLSKR